MRAGGGKAKGSGFERLICKKLSLWVSHGREEDCFWRSAMSGGRATVSARKGKELRRQVGDITATAPEGHSLTERFFIECKTYRTLKLDSFLLAHNGPLALFWRRVKEESRKVGKDPFLIVKQNRFPVVAILDSLSIAAADGSSFLRYTAHNEDLVMCLFDDLMRMQYIANF